MGGVVVTRLFLPTLLFAVVNALFAWATYPLLPPWVYYAGAVGAGIAGAAVSARWARVQ